MAPSAYSGWLMSPQRFDLPDLVALVRRPAWHARAACRGAPTEVFFPPGGGSVENRTAMARMLCDHCPVVNECRAFAEADESLVGWWAGGVRRKGGTALRLVG